MCARAFHNVLSLMGVLGFCSAMQKLATPFFNYEFVRRALTIGIERTDRERELVSRLLSYIYGSQVTMEQIGMCNSHGGDVFHILICTSWS